MRAASVLATTLFLLAAGCGRSGIPDEPPERGADASPAPFADAGGTFDASSLDAPTVQVDASRPEAASPQRWSCAGFSGVQENAPWPVVGRCPDRKNASPVIGPTSTPEVAWTSTDGQLAGRGLMVIDADGTIYSADDSRLVAIAPNGTTKWTASLGTSALDGVLDLALGRSGLLYARNGVGVYAFNTDGSTAWSLPFSSGPTQSCGGAIALGAGETLIVSPGCSSSILAFGPDAKQRWTTTLPGYPVPLAPAVSPDGTVEVIGWTNGSGSPGGRVFALGGDGTIITSSPPLSFDSYPFGFDFPAVGADGTAYFSVAAGVAAIVSNGSTSWVLPMFAPLTSPAIGPDGTVLVADRAGKTLYAIAPSGSTSWSYAANIVPLAPPVIGGDGTVYLGIADSSDSQASGPSTLALTATGRVEWELPGGGVPMAIGADGTLYTRGGTSLVGPVSALVPPRM